jgi:hypothetical protein
MRIGVSISRVLADYTRFERGGDATWRPSGPSKREKRAGQASGPRHARDGFVKRRGIKSWSGHAALLGLPVRPGYRGARTPSPNVTKLILRSPAAVSDFFGMRSRDESGPGPFCKRGGMAGEGRQLAFRQQTDNGDGHCQVSIALTICTRCGFASWDAAAEATIGRAVHRHYARLGLSFARALLAGPPRRG